jgi:glycosyltransferase involved in cell wall biosynthesis
VSRIDPAGIDPAGIDPAGIGPVGIDTVGIVVPAHNEQDLVGGCLDALAVAGRHPVLVGVRVHTLVVLDDCSDRTGALCASRGVATLAVRERNAGRVRAAGWSALLAAATNGQGRWDRHRGLWLATTDADTRVAPDWLAEQVRLARAGADATFGVVDVDDWRGAPAATPTRFAAAYGDTPPGDTAFGDTAFGDPVEHQHVHGANMGLRADAYLRVGGIPKIPVGEDRALSALLRNERDLRVARTTSVRATTSARLVSRVRGGFADYLRGLTPAPEAV